MIERMEMRDRQFEEAIRAAFSTDTEPPADLCARIRLAVRSEAVREPIRRRRRLCFRISLSFAFACLAGFMVYSAVRKAGIVRDPDDGRAVIVNVPPRTEASGRERLIGGSNESENEADVPLEPRGIPPNVLVHQHDPRAPRMAHAVQRVLPARPGPENPRPRNIWTHQRWAVVDVPIAFEDPTTTFAPSSIRISVTDPAERQVRSLQMRREVQNGDVHADIQYEARPILTSAGN